MDAAGVVGRGAELAAIEAAFDRAPAGPVAVILAGEAGIGKSTVWEAAVDAARSRGWVVLSSRPARAEHGLTLAGLTDLLAAIGDDTLAALPGPQRDALGVALLRVDPGDAPPDQRALSVATTALLRRLASDGHPVVVAIDDLQWLDPGSGSILAFALRRLRDRSIAVLASIRSGEEAGVADAVLDALPHDRVERLTVGPLHLASLHRLFERRLGRSFPRVVLLRLEQASGGNPLYALELARALVATGTAGDPRTGLPMPESLGTLIAGRVARLPPRTRCAMLVAAAATDPSAEALGLALALPAAALHSALRAAIDDGLVAVEGGAVRFRHPLFAQAVIAAAPAEELRDVHRRLSSAARTPDGRARHLAQAVTGPDESVAAALEAAAADARQRGSSLDAATLYREAARLTPSPASDAALDRARLAAECLFVDLSEYVEADRILEAAIDAAEPGAARAAALSLRGIVRYYHGRLTDALALGEQALAEVGEEPVARATVLGRLAYLRMQVDLDRGLDEVDDAVRLLEAAAERHPVDPDLLANAILLRAAGELGALRPTRPGAVERVLALISVGGRSWEKEGAEGSAFGLARHTDDLDRAIAMTRDIIRSKSGPGGDDPFNVVMLAGLLLYRGDWAEARDAAEAAAAEYRREGADLYPAWALRGLALVAAHDGRLEAARAWAAAGLADATARGDVILAVFHHHLLGFIALTEETWPAAWSHLEEAVRLADAISTRHPGRFKLAGDLVETALALGDIDRAAAMVARCDEAIRVAPTPWVAAVGPRCAGLVAAARGDLDGAAALLESAVAAHDALPMPFERGRTLLVKGRLHRRRKEKRLADETLREALAVFERLGAPDWAAKARQELGRVGRRPHAPDALTDTELRVAQLAATGLTSREIAERAFLAPKTVGNVLGRVYDKLAIHSRAELGAAMAGIAAAAEVANRID